ncbi:hypothetical protein Trydic_g14049 [Trypoxylus dichotomus]
MVPRLPVGLSDPFFRADKSINLVPSLHPSRQSVQILGEKTYRINNAEVQNGTTYKWLKFFGESNENIYSVRESAQDSPDTSTRRRSAQLEVTRSSIQRILATLKMLPYKMKPIDYE